MRVITENFFIIFLIFKLIMFSSQLLFHRKQGRNFMEERVYQLNYIKSKHFNIKIFNIKIFF